MEFFSVFILALLGLWRWWVPSLCALGLDMFCLGSCWSMWNRHSLSFVLCFCIVLVLSLCFYLPCFLGALLAAAHLCSCALSVQCCISCVCSVSFRILAFFVIGFLGLALHQFKCCFFDQKKLIRGIILVLLIVN